MPSIARDAPLQTVITTFEVSPGTCHDLLELLHEAYDGFISRQPGFLGAALHVNDAQTRIANYSQWRKREDFLRCSARRRCAAATARSPRCARPSSR